MFCRSLFVLLCFFPLAIVLSVLLRYTDSDYLFGIFKLVFHKKRSWKVECSCSLETCWMLLEFELDMNLCGSVCSKFWRIVGEKWMYALAYRMCITDWYKFVKVKGAYHVCFMNQILTFSQETFVKSWMCLSTRSLLNSSWIWTLSELAYESLKQIVCSKLLPNLKYLFIRNQIKTTFTLIVYYLFVYMWLI